MGAHTDHATFLGTSAFRTVSMIQLIFEQALGQDFSEYYDLVVAQSNAQKAQIYDLRCRSSYADSPNKGIDAFDSVAKHLFLRHRQSGRAIAATRLIEKSPQSGQIQASLPIEQRLQPEMRCSGLYLPAYIQNASAGERLISELSELHVLPVTSPRKIEP